LAIPIIDLFAGPGGLGEGFTSVVDKKGKRAFRIALSIEKDEFAHDTLTLRSFIRQFPHKKLPIEYYQFVRGEIEKSTLYAKYPKEHKEAQNEAWQFELGKQESHRLVDHRIRKALDGQKQFILIGGPPCQAYSLVGRARRRQTTGLDKDDVRVYLYREYYRILGEHKPPIFIMENVKGLLSSKVDSEMIFKQLISDLGNPVESYRKLNGGKDHSRSRTKYKIYSLVKKPRGYTLGNFPIFHPSDFIVRSEEYGIPQTRHRIILLGIRQDLHFEPELLEIFASHVSTLDAIGDMPALRSGLSKEPDTKETWIEAITQLSSSSLKKEVNAEIWKAMSAVIESLQVPSKDRGKPYMACSVKYAIHPDWYADQKLKGLINHETRSHIRRDLYRYLFASCFAKVFKRSPKMQDFPASLLPKHGNVSLAIDENKFADRFRVQVADEPAKTITSHISKDGHYYIHPDAKQCRSLTVREAARIQTFPDNYFFLGPRTEQYHQVGNAVPPLLAKQIAIIIQKLF
jgi:DNA (cytosine-5)-methyltransferase 1